MDRPKSLENCLNGVKYEQYINNLQGRLPSLADPNDIDCKRWPWELIQNAKDTVIKRPTENRHVNVTFKYFRDEKGRKILTFTHDGEQFTDKAITGLIWKFSAEKRDEQITEDGLRRDKQSTGRFGTGFMTTHALSLTVDIVGSIFNDDEGVKRNVSVEFTLHREGPTDDDYRNGVNRTENEMIFDRIPIPNGESQLNTTFKYYILNDSGEKAARIGLENVCQNAAITMLFCPTIRSITIEDDINESRYRIIRGEWRDEKNVIKRSTFTEIFNNRDPQKRSFISFEVDEESEVLSRYWHTESRHQRIHAAIEIDENDNILVTPATSPSIYCALPLIGFERMHLPFFLNSNDFETQRERVSLFLNQREKQFVYNPEKNCEEETIFNNGVNWTILRRSTELFEKIVDYAVLEGFGCRYNLINGLNSILKETWTPEEKNCLAARFILPMRQMLSSKELVRVNDNYRSISSNVRFVECSIDKDRDSFYNICAVVYPDDIVDKSENQEWVDRKWSKFSFDAGFDDLIKDDLENPFFSTVSYKVIADYIESAASMDKLVLPGLIAQNSSDVNSSLSKLSWLNSFYLWINNAKLTLLADMALVPNRKGVFCTCEQGCVVKDASDIPSEVFSFMKSIQIDLDDTLLLEGVDHVQLEKVTIDSITSTIKNRTKAIVSEGANVFNSLLPVLLSLPVQSHEITDFYTKRTQIISIISTMFPNRISQFTTPYVLGLKPEAWDVADHWFIKEAINTIAKRGSIDIQEEKDSEEAKQAKYCTAQWLSSTLVFMFKHGYLHRESITSSKDGNSDNDLGIAIIPNRYGQFKTLDQLYSAGQIPKELLNDTLNKTGFDIKDQLLWDGFILSDKISINDFHLDSLTSKYTEFFGSTSSDENKEAVADYLIHLLPNDTNLSVELTETRALYDMYMGKTAAQTYSIQSSDLTIWTGANIFLINHLAALTSKQQSLLSIGRHLDTTVEKTNSPTDEDFASMGLDWLNRLHVVAKNAKIIFDEDLCLYPDWEGTLQTSSTAKYDGSILRQFTNIDELIGIRKELWAYYSDENKSEEEGILNKIVSPGFIYVNDFQNDTASVLFKHIDKVINYCIDNRTTASFPILKKSISTLIDFFDDNDFNRKDNEASAISFFPSTYSNKSDLQCDYILDRETKKRLSSLNNSFSPEELDGLISDSGLIRDVLKDREHIKHLEEENAQLKERLEKLETLLIVDDKEHADSEEGQIGEKVVWEELQKRYPESEGYRVIWSSRDYNEARFDFKIEKDGQVYCYCDAKSTSRGINNSDSIPFFLRKSQYLFLRELKDTIPYYIARVFISDDYKIHYFKICLS